MSEQLVSLLVIINVNRRLWRERELGRCSLMTVLLAARQLLSLLSCVQQYSF